MGVTIEELQEAGASPKLARLLAERQPQREVGDLAKHPMAVTLAGIVLAAFLSALGWLVLGVSGLQTDVALLREGQTGIEERMTGIEERMTGIEGRMTGLEDRMAGIEGRMTGLEEKLDRLLQE